MKIPVKLKGVVLMMSGRLQYKLSDVDPQDQGDAQINTNLC